MKKINFNIVGKFGTILADPPWEFKNKTGKIAPQYKKTNRYNTLSLEDIKSLPVERVSSKRSHLIFMGPKRIYQRRFGSDGVLGV
jgi:N6-adenosine-specific RNA methylase IME4